MCIRKPAFAGVFAIALLLAACTPQQLADANRYQAQIEGACSMLIMLAPVAGAMAPWIYGGCESEQAIAKLALDPGSLTWLKDMLAKLRG